MCPLTIYLNVIMLAPLACNWTYHAHSQIIAFAHTHAYVHAHDYMHTITLRRILKCPRPPLYKYTHPCNKLKCNHSYSPHIW